MNKKVIAPERERLRKLYTIGKEVEFEDEDGTVTLWLQKVNPDEDAEAARQSYKVRAKLLTLLKNKDDPERIGYVDSLSSWGIDSRDAKVNFLIAPKIREVTLSKSEKVAAEKEWADNDYLISLQEAWNSGMKEKYDLDNNDEEASRVFAELKRYTEIVEAEVEHERLDLYNDMDQNDDEYLTDKVVDQLIEYEAGQAQMQEYHHWQIFFATRLASDHEERFFESREEMAQFGDLYSQLFTEYIDMTLDVLEGKD